MLVILPSRNPAQASFASVASAARLLGHELGFLAIRALDEIANWHERLRERESLRAMDERMLKDVGLSRADIAHEGQKTFWQP